MDIRGFLREEIFESLLLFFYTLKGCMRVEVTLGLRMQCVVLNREAELYRWQGSNRHLSFSDEKAKAQGDDVISCSLQVW